jgi:hypothetical protein
MVMTHLTDVADRIDRSKPPWGGREERELDDLLKNSTATEPFQFVLFRVTRQDGFYCSRNHLVDASL